MCSQVYGVSWNVSLPLSRYPVWYGDANRCDARSQGCEEVRDQGWGQSRVGGLPAAAHVPRRDEGAARDAGGPVGAAAGDPGSGTGLIDRSGIGCARAGPGSDRFPPARTRRCGPRPGRRPAWCRPTTRWWADTTLADDLGVDDATTDEVYAAMDWLAGRQDAIESKLVRTHLTSPANPDRLALFDLSSSWVTGRCCPLAARGYSRDGKKGLPQIEYGLLTDPAGRPVAVRVFPGNTADPTAFTTIVDAVRDTFKLTDMLMVGDRGMITSARVEALRELGGFGWVTALRAPAIAALAADDGPLQMSLFDQANLAEITHPDYPGERLIACRNPALATERARKRLALMEATDTEPTKIVAAVAAGRLAGAGKIGVRVGKVVGRYKMAKHYTLTITDDTFSYQRNTQAITAEAALDGLYVIRTTVGPEQMDAAKVVATYKSLARVERDFRSIKSIDLDLRPIHHYTETRVRAHVFICMLAAYLTWHLRQAWAPLTFTDENRPEPID